ncbi:MAG TPA: hypothetical protein VK445_12670 [Dissulfurispiraceae bacterium]|nr:hypothetical protein [Dissulfurispiraceae bacterium]
MESDNDTVSGAFTKDTMNKEREAKLIELVALVKEIEGDLRHLMYFMVDIHKFVAKSVLYLHNKKGCQQH